MTRIGNKLRRLAWASGPLLLAGCVNEPPIGQVVQHNILAQVVDMDPQYAGVPIEGGNGQRTVDAIRRYNAAAARPLQSSAGGSNAPK
jgi:hypothetical protein